MTNTAVKIKSENDKELVIEKTDGTDQTFYKEKKVQLQLNLKDAQLRLQSASQTSTLSFNPTIGQLEEFRPLVVGNVTLENQQFFSVMGEPSNRTGTFSFTLKQATFVAERNYSAANIDFVRRDQDFSNEDKWTIESWTTEAVMSELLSAMRFPSLSAIHLGLVLRDVFSDRPRRGSVDFDKRTFFLRPSGLDNSIESPQTAEGNINWISINFNSVLNTDNGEF